MDQDDDVPSLLSKPVRGYTANGRAENERSTLLQSRLYQKLARHISRSSLPTFFFFLISTDVISDRLEAIARFSISSAKRNPSPLIDVLTREEIYRHFKHFVPPPTRQSKRQHRRMNLSRVSCVQFISSNSLSTHRHSSSTPATYIPPSFFQFAEWKSPQRGENISSANQYYLSLTFFYY